VSHKHMRTDIYTADHKYYRGKSMGPDLESGSRNSDSQHWTCNKLPGMGCTVA